MRHTVLFSVVTTALCMVSGYDDNTRLGQKVKRTVESLGYYAPPYFVNIPGNDYQFSKFQLPPQKDPNSDEMSFSAYRSSFSTPFDISRMRTFDMGSEEPSHSSEHLMFEGEEVDDEHPHSHSEDPLGDYKQKSAQVSHSEEEERVQTGYVYSDRPTYHPIVNTYETYCPRPALPQPNLPIDLPMLRPDLPYPVIRDRVNTQKPKNFNAILENFKKLAEQEGLLVDYPSELLTSFDLLKKRLKERPARPRTDRILMNVFQNEGPNGEFSVGSEELNGNTRPSNFPINRISDGRGENPYYERRYNYGRVQNPIEYKYNSPQLQISEPYFRLYPIVEKPYQGSFPKFKASIL